MMTPPYTVSENRMAVEREVVMRQRVYPRWMAEGRMTKEKMEYQIAVMQAIAEDYRKLEAGERLI